MSYRLVEDRPLGLISLVVFLQFFNILNHGNQHYVEKGNVLRSNSVTDGLLEEQV